MLTRLNQFAFGLFSRFSTYTYRRFEIDNYVWAAVGFLVAAVASVYIYFVATARSPMETQEIADMRKTACIFAVFLATSFAATLLYFRKDIRQQATKHYDMGKKLSPWLSLMAWFAVLQYPATLKFTFWPGMLDMFFVGIAMMFLFTEPPPMETRMDKAFSKRAAP